MTKHVTVRGDFSRRGAEFAKKKNDFPVCSARKILNILFISDSNAAYLRGFCGIVGLRFANPTYEKPAIQLHLATSGTDL